MLRNAEARGFRYGRIYADSDSLDLDFDSGEWDSMDFDDQMEQSARLYDVVLDNEEYFKHKLLSGEITPDVMGSFMEALRDNPKLSEKFSRADRD